MKKCALPGCGKKIPRTARNQKFCSPEHMQEAIRINNLPENKKRIQEERKGPAKITPHPKTLLRPDEVEVGIDPSLTTHLPGNPDTVVFKKDDWEKLTGAVKIPFQPLELPQNPTEEQTRAKIMDDLIMLGRSAYEETADGIRRLDPLGEEVLAALAQNGNEILNPILDEAGKFQEEPPASPWQGDAPEGTLAHKLKYGVWYKDGHEPA